MPFVTAVLPEKAALLPLRVVVPVPTCDRAPVPLIAPARLRSLLRLKTSVPLLVTSPTMLPEVPPLPSCKVPAVMVVPPV